MNSTVERLTPIFNSCYPLTFSTDVEDTDTYPSQLGWGVWKKLPQTSFRFTGWNEQYEGSLGNYLPNEGYF